MLRGFHCREGSNLMELLVALAIGLLTACGLYLVLRSRTFSVVLGLVLLSYATNLFIFAAGRLAIDRPALIAAGPPFSDPLPQALVLTAIVISFAMTAFLVVLVLRARAELGSERVDGPRGQANP